MTDISKETIAAMLDGVTPGPWFTTPAAPAEEWPGWHVNAQPIDALRGYTLHVCDVGGMNDNEAVARFIAYAREAVPALAARVAELEAALDEINGCHTFALNELSAAEAEAARLREVVTAEIDAHSRYEELPVDRGGKVGPKGLAFAAWLAARASVIAALQEKPE